MLWEQSVANNIGNLILVVELGAGSGNGEVYLELSYINKISGINSNPSAVCEIAVCAASVIGKSGNPSVVDVGTGGKTVIRRGVGLIKLDVATVDGHSGDGEAVVGECSLAAVDAESGECKTLSRSIAGKSNRVVAFAGDLNKLRLHGVLVAIVPVLVGPGLVSIHDVSDSRTCSGSIGSGNSYVSLVLNAVEGDVVLDGGVVSGRVSNVLGTPLVVAACETYALFSSEVAGAFIPESLVVCCEINVAGYVLAVDADSIDGCVNNLALANNDGRSNIPGVNRGSCKLDCNGEGVAFVNLSSGSLDACAGNLLVASPLVSPVISGEVSADCEECIISRRPSGLRKTMS